MKRAIVFLLASFATIQLSPSVFAQAKEYRVPYRLTESSHIVVRIKVNGEGPFNVILDSGAPALFLTPEAANMAKLQYNPQNPWSQGNLEIEGGPTIQKIDIRVDKPMQVKGMNDRKLCGVRLDGMMGYPIMGRFKTDIDMTRPYLIWTRLNYAPPPAANSNPRPAATTVDPPAQLILPRQARPNSVFGDLRDAFSPPGYLGIELDPNESPLKITGVAKGSPADAAGVKAGDLLIEFSSTAVQFPEDALRLMQKVNAGAEVTLKLQRGQENVSVNLKASAGL